MWNDAGAARSMGAGETLLRGQMIGASGHAAFQPSINGAGGRGLINRA